jgi:hypothetical protein
MQFHFKPSPAAPVSPAHLTAFVTADLRFDIPAIRADAKARYALKLDFINRYTGSANRYWQIRQARQAIRLAWREAREQHHRIVTDRLPLPLPYTAEEAARRAQLRATIIGLCPASAPGMADFKAASGEYAQINFNARQRAYFAIIREARGEA